MKFYMQLYFFMLLPEVISNMFISVVVYYIALCA